MMMYTLHKNSLSFTQADLELKYTREGKAEEKVNATLHTKNTDIETLAASFQKMASSVSLYGLGIWSQSCSLLEVKFL